MSLQLLCRLSDRTYTEAECFDGIIKIELKDKVKTQICDVTMMPRVALVIRLSSSKCLRYKKSQYSNIPFLLKQPKSLQYARL